MPVKIILGHRPIEKMLLYKMCLFTASDGHNLGPFSPHYSESSLPIFENYSKNLARGSDFKTRNIQFCSVLNALSDGILQN